MQIFIPLIIASVIGWLTVRFVILLLFRPWKEMQFGPLRLQGIIAQWHAELTVQLNHAANLELETGDPDRILHSPEFPGQFETFLRSQVAIFTESKIRAQPPGLENWLRRSGVAARIDEAIVDIIILRIPKFLETIEHLQTYEEEFHLLIHNELLQITPAEMEKLVRIACNRELRALELLGVMLGTAVGLIQAAIVGMLQ